MSWPTNVAPIGDAAGLVDDEVRLAGVAVGLERRRRRPQPRSYSTTRTSKPCSRASRLGQPDRADLRVGEHDLRHHPRRRRRRGTCVSVAMRLLVDPLRARHDHVGADAGLVLALVGQRHPAVDVADRVEPVERGGAQGVVDLDGLAGLEPDGVEPDVGGVRVPAEGGDDLVGGHRLLPPESERDGDRDRAVRRRVRPSTSRRPSARPPRPRAARRPRSSPAQGSRPLEQLAAGRAA